MGCSSSTAASASQSISLQRQIEIAALRAHELMCKNQEDFAAIDGVWEDSDEVESFTVMITKEAGVPFGAALAKDICVKYEEVAVVASIDENGYLETWNRKHLANDVRLGDRIVSVNDCSSDYWGMVAQLWWRAGVCKLTVERSPNSRKDQHRSGSRVYLADYISAQACSNLAYGSPSDCLKVTRAADASASVCAVCFEDYEDPEEKVVVLPCTHVFHSGCVVRWLCKGSKSCPLCKLVVNGQKHGLATHDEASMENAINIGETYV